MYEHRTGRGPKQLQLLMCKINDEVESDFAIALELLEFEELLAPDYGGLLPGGKAPSYTGSEWINVLFLSFVPVEGWDIATKRDSFGPGHLVPAKQRLSEDKVDVLSTWLSKVAEGRGVDFEEFSERFVFFAEPSRSEFEKHRRAAEFIAHLPELYRKALKVLKDVDIDLVSASETAITHALKKHKMPRLCITCLNGMSLSKLIDHLVKTTLADASHIYSLDDLKDERDIVREKLKEGTEEETQMLKVVCAVKFASLIQLPQWAWAAIGQRIKSGRRRQRRVRNGERSE